MWVKKEMPKVPSLEDSGAENAKRFTSTCLSCLLTHRQAWIKEWMDKLGINSMRSAIEFVIRNIDYPLTRGRPDDKHVWNAFSGKACYTIPFDYWQSADETLMTYVLNMKAKGAKGYGDCEDVSILTVSMLRILDIPCYVVFGLVYQDSTLLGGHGWAIAEFPDGKWRLIEATLDSPPSWFDGYPVVDKEKNMWKYYNITYEGWLMFNEKEYYEWEGNSSMFEKYAKIKFEEKETLRKHVALSEAYKTKTKALRKRGILGRIRWH